MTWLWDFLAKGAIKLIGYWLDRSKASKEQKENFLLFLENLPDEMKASVNAKKAIVDARKRLIERNTVSLSVVSNDNALEYKNTSDIAQFHAAPNKLKEVAYAFAKESFTLGITPVVTRVLDKASPNESGVHQQGRAIDFRCEYDGKTLYNASQIGFLLNFINHKFARSDKFKTIICHSFEDGPMHFHIQIPVDWID